MVLSDRLRSELMDQGAALVGCADLSALPAEVRGGKRYGVSIAVALKAEAIEGMRTGPTAEYYAEYLRANELLAALAEEGRKFLTGHGYEAVAKAPTYVGIDPKTHRTVLPHKTVATRAGLGWIGKCALLVTEKYGSAVRMTTVLTDAVLAAGTPVDASRCGSCLNCVNACPGKAPLGGNWDINEDRDAFYDADKCSTAAKHSAMTHLHINETICGLCIVSCPWTQRYIETEAVQKTG